VKKEGRGSSIGERSKVLARNGDGDCSGELVGTVSTPAWVRVRVTTRRGHWRKERGSKNLQEVYDTVCVGKRVDRNKGRQEKWGRGIPPF